MLLHSVQFTGCPFRRVRVKAYREWQERRRMAANATAGHSSRLWPERWDSYFSTPVRNFIAFSKALTVPLLSPLIKNNGLSVSGAPTRFT